MIRLRQCLVMGSLLALPLASVRADESSDKALLQQLLAPAPAAPAPDKPRAERSQAPDGSAAPAPDAPADAALNAAQVAQYWKAYWGKVASVYAAIDDKHYMCATWDPNFPSSMHADAQAWQQKNTTERRVAAGGLIRTVKDTPPREEAVAVTRAIPDLAPNQYGFIHSAKVVEVHGPTEMLITDVELVDATRINSDIQAAQSAGDAIIRRQQEQDRIEQQRRNERQRNGTSSTYNSNNDYNRRDTSNDLTSADIKQQIDEHYGQRLALIKQQTKFKSVTLRLVGFPTIGASPGSRWTGVGGVEPQIAIVDDGKSNGKKSRGRNVELLAINADLLKKGISEDEFKSLLADSGLTPAQFVDIVRDKLKNTTGKDIDDLRPLIVTDIETARVAHEKETGEADAPGAGGDKPAKSADKPSFFDQKYGDKKDGDKPATEDKKPDKPSFLEQKYGDKKKSEAESSDKKKSDGQSFFEKKYGDKNKSKDEAKSDDK
ncbi:MAG: hypothetical protein GC162_20050 [Planctomycetes bacterium]|nr:hypothetical protein [Planctomycetota bacterium]